MDGPNLQSSNILRILERKSKHSLTGLSCDKLNTLHNTVYDNMLNTRVFSLGILSDKHCIDIIVGGLISSNRSAGSDIGEEIERSSEGQVERDMTFSNGGLQVISDCYAQMKEMLYSKRSLKSYFVLLDTLDCLGRDRSLAISQLRGHIDWLPLNWCLSSLLVDISKPLKVISIP